MLKAWTAAGQVVELGQLLPAHAASLLGIRSKKIFDSLMVLIVEDGAPFFVKKRLLLRWVIKHLSPVLKELLPRIMGYFI